MKNKNKWEYGEHYILNTAFFNKFQKKMGYTNRAVAAHLNCSWSTITQLKSGDLNVSYAMVDKLLNFTGRPFELLFIKTSRDV